MSASGTHFLQKFALPPGKRIFRVRQEIRNSLAHGRRRKSPAPGPSETLSATVAGARPSSKKLAARSPTDCAQAHPRTAGQPRNSPRRTVRKTKTHPKKCQMIHRTPATRETAVAAAHAEGKTVTKTTTNPNAGDPMAGNPAEAGAMTAATAKAEPGKTPAPASPSAAPCQNPSSSHGGKKSSNPSAYTKNPSAHPAQSAGQTPQKRKKLVSHAAIKTAS